MNKENTEKKDEEANGLNEMRLIKKIVCNLDHWQWKIE